jgi:hypothetical protein
MSLTTLLATISPGILLILMCFAAVVIATAGLSIVRRLVRAETLKKHNEIAGFVFGVLGAAYGVLLGFAVLQVWEQWSAAEDRAAVEEGLAESIHRHVLNYPDAEAARPLLAQYERYVHSVIHVEYPAMAKHRLDQINDDEFQAVWATAGQLRPASFPEQAGFSNIFTLLGDLAVHRELRLQSARGEVPTPLWYALLIGGFGTIAFSWLFTAERFSMQTVMVSALAIALVLPLYVIVLLNHPFSGSVRIEPESYRELLKNIATERTAPTPGATAKPPGR